MKRRKSNLVWGIILIAICVVLVLSQLGMLGNLHIGLWGLLFTALFGMWLIDSIISFDFTGILFSIAFLLIIYDDYLGITKLTPWTVLVVAFLGSIAFSLLFPKRTRRKRKRTAHHSTVQGDAHFDSFIDDADGDEVSCKSSFGSCTKYIHSQNLTRCYVDSSFGATELFLSDANIQAEYAEIIVNGQFCGIKIYIPRTWTVTNKIHATLGGVDAKNPGLHEGGGCKILLTGNIKFAGVEIIYV